MNEPRVRYWKAYCDEVAHPGLWKRWYLNQCIAIGWPPPKFNYGSHDGGDSSWERAKRTFVEIEVGDQVVVHLRGHCIGRIGEVVARHVPDSWDPLVRPRRDLPNGDFGRRIAVRWDLTSGPAGSDDIVQLPSDAQLTGQKMRRTLAKIDDRDFRRIRDAVSDAANWVSLRTRFAHETALSDFIATFPHLLEDGLVPHPSKDVREMKFPDGTRADVILIDRDERTVVVECKQGAPTADHVEQVLAYARHLVKDGEKNVRAILVHGGATKLPRELQRWQGQVEFVQYRLAVGFSACR